MINLPILSTVVSLYWINLTEATSQFNIQRFSHYYETVLGLFLGFEVYHASLGSTSCWLTHVKLHVNYHKFFLLHLLILLSVEFYGNCCSHLTLIISWFCQHFSFCFHMSNSLPRIFSLLLYEVGFVLYVFSNYSFSARSST